MFRLHNQEWQNVQASGVQNAAPLRETISSMLGCLQDRPATSSSAGSARGIYFARLMKLKAGKKLEPYEIIGPLVNWVEELKQRVPGR